MRSTNNNVFGKKFLASKIKEESSTSSFLKENRENLLKPIKKWLSMLDSGVIKDEESFQDPFIDTIFRQTLGYKRQGDSPTWECTREYKMQGGKSSDAALGFFENGKDEHSSVFAVIELKAPFTKDLSRKPASRELSAVEQGFDYSAKIGSTCHWVIVSNMDEIRLYHVGDQNRYESFNIAEIANSPTEMERFYFLLCRQNLLPYAPSSKESYLDKLYARNQADQAEINNKFYAIYSRTRQDIFNKLSETNPDIDKLVLLEKVQKILDRFLFMCFCEDKGFINRSAADEELTKFILNAPKKSFRGSIWNEFMDISRAIDEGSDQPIKIPPYDGGLFAKDSELENLNVSNDALESLRPIAEYDFDSELDVNILGHIFEQSVSDIEELKAKIKGQNFDEKKGKRKKQGIYYTPAYITSFIIEETIGAWIEREKIRLGFESLSQITEDEEKLLSEAEINPKIKIPKSLETKSKEHAKAWTGLQERLKQIKVLDPACGSGAFLNKAFDYLVSSHEKIASQRKHFGDRPNTGVFGTIDQSKFDDFVAKNNLFGVDLSKESVEITRLSLWLRLVYHKEKLPSLDHAIKHGDSIVADPAYTKVPFNWVTEFHNIFGGDKFSLASDTSGFDIVIGNPPYVRQEFLSPTKPALQKEYQEFYNGTADLYTYFYRRGFQLLKKDGYLGFITSSTFTKTSSGANLRRFLKNETAIDRFVDFGLLQLFDEATNLACIVIARNTKLMPDHKIQSSKIESLPGLETENLLEKAGHVEVAQNSLGEDSWNFDRPEVEALRRKIFSKGRPLKDVAGSPLYGIKTGLNEAFVIDRATRDRLIKEEFGQRSKQPHPDPLLVGEGESPSCGEDAVSANNSPSTYGRNAFSPNCSPSPCEKGKDELSCSTSPFGRGEGEGVFGDGLSSTNHPLIKPFLVGRDLKQWHYDFRERYLVAIQKGWTKQWAGKEDITEAKAWEVFEKHYPAVANCLKPFEERAKKRQDKGDFWWELRACEYYKTFEEPKIMYPEFMIQPKFQIDTKYNFFNNKVYFLPKGSSWLCALLTSRLMWLIIKKTCAVKLGEVFEMFTIYVEQFPIIDPTGDENNPSTPKGRLALLAKKAQEKAFKRLQLRHDLLEMIGDQLGQGKANEGDDAEEVSEGSDINKWDTLSWNDFVKKAQSPSAFGKAFKEQFAPMTRRLLDLKRLFEEMQPECKQLTEEIHACENEINQIVYGLYELTPDEIKLLEELTGNIYED